MKNGIKFYLQHDGEWIEPEKNYLMACCDCSLVHKMEFRVVKGRVQFRAWRDKRATAARRHVEKSGISKIFGKYLLSEKTAKKFGGEFLERPDKKSKSKANDGFISGCKCHIPSARCPMHSKRYGKK